MYEYVSSVSGLAMHGCIAAVQVCIVDGIGLSELMAPHPVIYSSLFWI